MSTHSGGPTRSPGPLLLPPSAAAVRRRWLVGRGPVLDPGAVVLPLAASTDSFVSLHDVWSALVPTFLRDRAVDFQRFGSYVGASREQGSFGSAGPSLALRRRISRESGPATRAVELGARLLLDGVVATYPDRTIVFQGVDEVDSLTLRTLARAAILLTDDHGLSFVFSSAVDPRKIPAINLTDLSRATILMNTARYGDFTFESGEVGPLPSRIVEARTLAQAAVDLVAHNYESTLLACDRRLGANGDLAEALRLSALAAVNLGALDDAESLLRRAVESTCDSGTRAHLYCLLALMTTKRRNDLVASEAFIIDGLRELDRRGGGSSDEAVERAWLLNARALNCALEYRQTSDLSLFRAAHDLEANASRLVAVGSSHERVYLRMNLLANMAFLWESAREPQNAIRVFEQVFEKRVSSDPLAQATLGYRLAVLHTKAGNYERAHHVLADLGDGMPPEEWCTIDHLLRARAHVAIRTHRYNEAERLARRGYGLALDAHSYTAAVAHAQAILQILKVESRTPEIHELVEQVVGLGVTRAALDRPLTLRPKLPAYIPEIDLEDVPSYDTNMRLSAD